MKYKFLLSIFFIILSIFIFTPKAHAAISSGSVTLKTAGGDYSSWPAFWADIANLDGNITLTVDASEFTESSAVAAVTETLGGHTLKVTAATFPTKTDCSDGPRITTSEILMNMKAEGAGTIIIEGISFTNSDNDDYGFYTTDVTTGFTYIVRRNVLKDFSYGMYYSDSSVTANWYNNFFYNMTNFAIQPTVAVTGFISNNTAYKTAGTKDGYNLNGQTGLWENNVYWGSTWPNFRSPSAATGNNNACQIDDCEDGDFSSGSNNMPEYTSDPFTDASNDDFTLASSTVDLVEAGKDISGSFTDDFFGNPRSAPWDIGAHELSSNDPPTIDSVSDTPDPVKARNYIYLGINWADAGDSVKVHFCKSDAITAATQTCDGGSWCDTTSFSTNDPDSCTYLAQDADIGSNNYYAFVCDDSNECSSSTSGSFTVSATDPSSVDVEGKLHIEGTMLLNKIDDIIKIAYAKPEYYKSEEIFEWKEYDNEEI